MFTVDQFFGGETFIVCCTFNFMETYFTFLEHVIIYVLTVHQCKITRELVGWGKATLTCAKTSTHIRLPAEGGNPPQSNPLHPFPEDAQRPSLSSFFLPPSTLCIFFYVVPFPQALFPSFSLSQKHGPSLLKQTFRLWKHSALHPSPPLHLGLFTSDRPQLLRKSLLLGKRPPYTLQ